MHTMPSSVRPKGSGGGNRGPPVTPMSERQQMALLMQMTSSNDSGSRSPSASSSARSRDRNERGETPLHLAAIKGDVEQVCKLLAHRADPNAADFAGWTPLHEACNHGWYEVAFRLVQAGANVNAKGLDNDTPLHDAAANGHIKLVKLLVERGADIHAKNSKGKTPLEIAPPSVTPFLYNPSLPLPETSVPTRVQPRNRDEKKIFIDANKTKSDDNSELKSDEDVYEFKSVLKETESAPQETNNEAQSTILEETNSSALSLNEESSSKRNFAEIDEHPDDVNTDDEMRRKKRKEEANKEAKNTTRSVNQNKTLASKQNTSVQSSKNLASSTSKSGNDKKSPCSSPNSSLVNNDLELEEGKSDLKVPPLKIVIPQTGPNEQDSSGAIRNKNNSQRSHSALPYVVASSNSSDSNEKDVFTAASPDNSGTNKCEEKKDTSVQPDDQKVSSHQRVLRSSLRGGTAQSTDRSSNNSSPQLQTPHSPSPSSSPAATATSNENTSSTNTSTNSFAKASDSQNSESNDTETAVANTNNNNTSTTTIAASTVDVSTATTTSCSSSTSTKNTPENINSDSSGSINSSNNNNPSTTTADTSNSVISTVSATSTAITSSISIANNASISSSSTPSVELHPRKRKMKPNKDVAPAVSEPVENIAEAQIHPHEQPIMNCYQLYLNIRKQIEKRRKGLFPVQPKPPQGFKDYLMNRCTYVLATNAPTTPNISYPPSLPSHMKELFTEQEKERYRLRMQHVIEKEKLVLSVEQEILRVHGRAARALANQSLPFSVCTILRDEEVYNLITPEQEEKDRNARSRYNGRLFLSWLQDVDDKWEKIKEHMLLRHHNEAESLHAVQKMDWEWKMKELNLCDRKSTPSIDEHHVPMVHVSDDFDLLPA